MSELTEERVDMFIDGMKDDIEDFCCDLDLDKDDILGALDEIADEIGMRTQLLEGEDD